MWFDARTWCTHIQFAFNALCKLVPNQQKTIIKIRAKSCNRWINLKMERFLESNTGASFAFGQFHFYHWFKLIKQTAQIEWTRLRSATITVYSTLNGFLRISDNINEIENWIVYSLAWMRYDKWPQIKIAVLNVCAIRVGCRTTQNHW